MSTFFYLHNVTPDALNGMKDDRSTMASHYDYKKLCNNIIVVPNVICHAKVLQTGLHFVIFASLILFVCQNVGRLSFVVYKVSSNFVFSKQSSLQRMKIGWVTYSKESLFVKGMVRRDPIGYHGNLYMNDMDEYYPRFVSK